MTMVGGLEASEVVVAGVQHIYVAPVGSTVPDDIDDDLGAEWYDLGYTTEDGIALSFGKDTDTVMSSQTLDPLRMLVTAAPKTITASLRQLNKETLKLALGGGEVTETGNKWKFNPAPASFIDIRMLAIEAEDGDKKYRFIYFRAMVSEAVEFSFVNTAGVVLPLTFSVLANEPFTFELQADEGDDGSGGGAPLNPSLASVTPDNGETGDSVALAGTNFVSGMSVTFAGGAATNVNVTSAAAATCQVPAGTGTVAVTVTVTGKPPASLPAAFTYN
jgi:IPT/TIG domain